MSKESMTLSDRLRAETESAAGDCCVPLVPLLNTAADRIDELENELDALQDLFEDVTSEIEFRLRKPKQEDG